MSRFVKRSENEPLLRLERPTLASSQTSAHIINSCFNEVLSQRQQMDSGAINNMAVSRRGDPNLYHDSFVEEAKQISDHYQRRLEDLLNVERHLLQAKAKALAEDERNLSQSATDLTTRDVVLPNGPSQFRKQLNEELLSRHCLLSPSQYLPQPLAPRDAPKEGPPSYLQSTYTWTQHALVPDGVDKPDPFISQKKKQSLKPIWRESLSQEEREAEKNRLAKLERKAGYLKNPKCSQSALNNTASSGPLKLKLQQHLDSYGVCKDAFQMFIAEPSELVFTDYQINQTYEATVVLKNVSGASRQLRLIPLNSPFFKVHTGYFPGSEGLIAPGMYCSYVVSFTPDSLTNYEEQLLVQCNNGEVLTVPLRSFRPPPDLSLPQELNCGHCLAGDTKTVVMKCDNFGGEGSFKLFPVDNSGDENNENLSDCLSLGPFSLSPTGFSLSQGGSIDLTTVFSPPAVGWYSEQFTMACDNGQILTFTLKGVADLITVGPIYTGYSSPQEITAYHTYAKSSGSPNGELPGDLSDSFDKEVVIEKLEWPTLDLAPTYPCKPSYSTVTIHNFSEVDLPFRWQFYRPLGIPLQVIGDAPIVNQLVPTSEKLFAVQPSSGILHARESKSFIYEFIPQRVGEFVDVAHLVFSGVDTDLSLDPSKADREWLRLSDHEVSIAHIELNGICEPYSIELEPCTIVLHEEVPSAVEVRKLFQMSNKSLSEVSYQWNCYEKNGLSVSVEPASGQLNRDEIVSSEVVIHADMPGPFSADLSCLLEQSFQSLPMLVEGCVQAPIVRVSVVNLDFGLIQFGRSASLKFDIINESHCPVRFQLQQLVKEKKMFMDQSCLSFSPSNEGVLEPLSCMTVTVECQPHETGRLRSIVQLLVDNQQPRFLAVIAEVQRPRVTLETAEFIFENAYVDIENHVSTKLVNTGLLPCYYSWSSQVYGDGDKHCNVDIHPMTGKIEPGQCVTVSVNSTWNKVGTYEARLKCDVINVESPLFLSLTSQVHGLAVTYRIAKPETPTDINISSESTSEDSQCEIALDYGDDNKLGEPVTIHLEISNPTTIPTSYEASVSYFPAAKPPTPPAQPMPGPNLLNTNRSRGRYLLNRTVNTADPRSKSQQQAAFDYASALLREGRGACFSVSPSTGTLPPSSNAVIKLTAYSNMWGQYRDQLLCKISGLETKVLPINYGVKGCPVVFQTTATSGYTLCRLGSHLPDAKTVQRVLKLKNTSPMSLRVDWRMSNIVQEDNKIVDLVTFIGDPFPKTSFLMDSSSDTMQTDHLNISSSANDEEVDTKNLNDEESNVQDSTSCLNDMAVDAFEPLIGALIKPHEGVSSSDPFDIHPRQITLPPHGYSTVQVSFQPSIKALNELGDQLASFAVGYISLDEESPISVKRLSGYDVEPLRIDTLAAIEHPKLSLECDEDSGLEFNCPASLLLEDNKKLKEQTVVSHHLTLANHGLSTVSIKLSTEERHFSVTGLEHGSSGGKEFTTLQPTDSVHFNLVFSFSCQDVRRNKLSPKSTSLHYSTSLCVQFSTGAKQVFPVSATVTLPGVSVSPGQLDFGTCHLGRGVHLSLLLLNSNPLAALWTIELLDQELDGVYVVSEAEGLLAAHLVEAGPTSHLLQVTFTPSEEKEYTGNLALTELITGGVLYIRVRGEGSADERHLR